MTKEQLARERDYGAALSIAKAIRKAGLISEKEFCEIDTMLSAKSRPIIGGLHA
jgi:hypothetical protein